MKAARLASPVAASALLGGALVFGRPTLQEVEIRTEPVAGTVSCLYGQGGNIGVSAGPDGVLLIDDQFLRLAPKIEAALERIADGEPVFLVNTHWHGDHTGGNPHFGRSATIVAHTNVRRRLAGDASIGGNVSTEELPAVALPEVTFDEGLSIHFNGEEVRLVHVPGAHTDGDTVVWFTGSNVVHLGDLFFQAGYPFIDTASGGDVEGLIAGVRGLLERIPADARLIPGHGAVSDADGLREYLSMVETITERVREHLADGWSVDEMMEAGLTEEFDGRWDGGFISSRRFVEIVVDCLGE